MQLKRQKEPSKLEVAIDNLLDELNDYPGYDEDYAKRVKMLEKLHKIKKGSNTSQVNVNSDTLIVVGGNVIIALILIGFEQKHVITTKATTFFSKLR